MSGSVSFLCPSCSATVAALDRTTRCPTCSAIVELRGDAEVGVEKPIERCALCGSEALYIAKDFNKNLGVAIVALACVAFYWGPIAGVATLVGLTLLDRLVYYLRPLVTVCYGCTAVYRGIPLNPTHKPYELTFDETFEGSGEPIAFRKAIDAEPPQV